MIIEKKPNFKLRIISGVVLGILFASSLFWLPLLQYFIIPVIAAGMLAEWYDITNSLTLYLLLGLIIIPLSIISLLLITSISNIWLLLTYAIIIVSVDSFAMFGGITFKGPKLAPVISPNKTISGLICGVLGAGLMVKLLSFLPQYNVPKLFANHLFIISIIMAVISQVSDLFISFFKRKFGVKDSGSIIPGHGGILDRFDSIILTSPILLILLMI